MLGNVPFDPAITTWNCARVSPVFTADSGVISEPHREHLMLVRLAGLGHPASTSGSRVGSRSKKMLKLVQRSWASQRLAHFSTS